MAIAKKQKQEEGAPAWMVTYGDMVTLMLTFFVMLLAMSEVKKEDQFIEFMQAIRDAFGYNGGTRQVHLEDVQIPRNVDLMEMLILPIQQHDFSKTRDPGIQGKQKKVRDNPERDVFVVGGRIQFPSLSAEPDGDEVARLAQFADEVRGHSTLIRVTGHCSRRPVKGTPFTDHMDLSYHRARVVRELLIKQGIEPERIVIEADGTNQPVAEKAYTAAERQQNDLVEILQVDVRVGEPGE